MVEGQLEILKQIQWCLEKYGVKPVHVEKFGAAGLFFVFAGPKGVTGTVRIHPEGVVTLTLEYFVCNGLSPLFSTKELQRLRDEVEEKLKASRSRLLPPVQRGLAVDPYLTTSDERLLQYDFDVKLFEERTPYQKVMIVHSPSLGNALILDDLINLAESDGIYTDTLMLKGRISYKGKTCLILGGGDGALLHQLLQEDPDYITMVEIDEVVMQACSKHMRSVCGDSMDSHKGLHHEIIVGDAVATMEEYVKEGRRFDFVFGDLTDIPISTDPTAELWLFFRRILTLALSLLAPSGIYLSHANGVSSHKALSMFEEQLGAIDPPVKFSKCSAYVPSFMEPWVFYQVWYKHSPPVVLPDTLQSSLLS
ncbi:unnamed protein product [Darwinula stevensoni]|uniref:PABS domain-containing protein n=1 Tax=Darwinula stevensoni TaxID=69355 RepID=A0A7R9A6I3_9CRUS|nr:unnamed protein product [Darwinula stevensoni]CAG0889275.1 unnamed protein product [Darwinula stevensoni]